MRPSTSVAPSPRARASSSSSAASTPRCSSARTTPSSESTGKSDAVNDQALPEVAVFSLGGTIASTNTGDAAANAGVTPRLGAQELVDAVPQLRDVARLETVAFRQVASGDLTFPDLVALAGEIDKRF